jgi:hypothetical protein
VAKALLVLALALRMLVPASVLPLVLLLALGLLGPLLALPLLVLPLVRQ